MIELEAEEIGGTGGTQKLVGLEGPGGLGGSGELGGPGGLCWKCSQAEFLYLIVVDLLLKFRNYRGQEMTAIIVISEKNK